MRFRVGRLEIRVHPLLPMFVLLMLALDAADMCVLAFASVMLHELGHLIAARALGLHALELEIMPLGGVVHIGGLYRLPSSKIIAVAAAGPIVSMLLTVAAMLLPEYVSLEFMLLNAGIFLFNMLPGLPMDGGRILSALLRRHMGVKRSVNIAVRIGQGAGAVLLTAGLLLWMRSGRLPIPVMLMSIYLIACAHREADVCELSPAEDMARLLSAARLIQPLPLQAISCRKDAAADQVLKYLRPDRCTLLIDPDTETWVSDMQWLRGQIRT